MEINEIIDLSNAPWFWRF